MTLHCRLCGDPIQPLRDGWAHWPGLGGSCPGPRPEPECPRCLIENKPCAQHCDPGACPDPAHRPQLAPCEGCGAELHWQEEKALSGELALVMAGPDGAWVCPSTGDEHAPPF